MVYRSVVSILNSAANLYVPKRRKNFYKFWWDEELNVLKASSTETNNIWRAAGKPRKGLISQSARWCRTVVRETSLVNGTPRFLDPRWSKTPDRSTSNLAGVITSGISPHTHTLVFLSLRGGGGCTYAWNCHHPCLFFTPRYFFIPCAPVEIAPFDRFSCFMAQKTCFGDSYVLFGVRTKFFNNFHPPIRRKTTLWMRATSVAYKTEQSVICQKKCFSDSYVISGVRRKIC